MNGPLKSVLTYGAAFAAAVALHVGLAAVIGGGLRSAPESPAQTELAAQQEPLAVTFRRPEAVTLEPRPAAAVTRLRKPEPPPNLEPEPSSETPPAAEPPVSADPPVEEPREVLPEERSRIPETPQTRAAAAEAAAQSAQARARGPAAPAVRVTKPRPLVPIDAEAIYPLGSRLRGEEGAVRLIVSVDARGRVELLEVVESSGFGALDGAAERAVRRTRFAPASRDGRVVADHLTITIRFRLDS